MDKRFTLFLFVAMTLMVGFIWLNSLFLPEKPAGKNSTADSDGADSEGADSQTDTQADDASDGGTTGDDSGDDGDGTGDDVSPNDTDDSSDEPSIGADPDSASKERADVPQQAQWEVVGHFDGKTSPYLAFFNSRGGALERLELVERDGKRFRYGALAQRHGYLGYLALQDVRDGGCRVRVIAPGTPAALATSDETSGGLMPGDIIVAVQGKDVSGRDELDRALNGLSPGTAVELSVVRPASADEQDSEQPSEDGVDEEKEDEENEGGDAPPRKAATDSRTLTFKTKLSEKPLTLIGDDDSEDSPPKSRSAFTLAINQFRERSGKVNTWAMARGDDLTTKHWKLERPGEHAVALTTTYSDSGQTIEVQKRFSFKPATKEEREEKIGAQYHFDYAIRARTIKGSSPLVGFRIDGPRGLPTEGWWYINKIHPSMFASAGTRDVTWNVTQGGHQIRGTKDIYSHAKKAAEDDKQPFKPIFVAEQTENRRTLRYIGVDTPYFNVSFLPADNAKEGTMQFDSATPVAASNPESVEKKRFKLCDTSFWLATKPVRLEKASGNEWSYSQKFVVFAGPKRRDVLEEYGLEENIYYGWFGWVAKPLSTLMHLFYAVVRNYGLAIVMLTIFVRALIFPLSRKAARNAQTMQILAPELKKLTEKYKDDMEKRAQAQREVYQKYGFNPFGGCGLALLQLPIFMGLYRSISVDIDLRQAPLIPGLSWCNNLAGPDMLYEWTFMPQFLAGKTAWLGPYFNVLPAITIVLFVVQQKMFTPPATDEQTKAQQAMMKYMMIFVGVLFFKVPAGLCIYFVASSIWSIGERKLIPKPEVDLAEMERKAKEKQKNGGGGFLQRLMEDVNRRAEAAKEQSEEAPPSAQERRNARRKKRRK